MSIHDSNEASEASTERSDRLAPATNPPASHSRAGMSWGMGGKSVPLVLAVLVGMTLVALVVSGAGVPGVAQIRGWGFLLSLLPCLLMLGAMMMMTGNKSGSDENS